MTTIDPNINDMQRAVRDALHAHWVLFLAQGVIMVILGAVAFAAPTLATIAVDMFVGWLFLISGVFGLAALFSVRGVPAFIWTLIMAALSVVVGAMLIWRPVEGVFSLTLVLTAFFIVEGIFQILASFTSPPPIPGSCACMFSTALPSLLSPPIIIPRFP